MMVNGKESEMLIVLPFYGQINAQKPVFIMMSSSHSRKIAIQRKCQSLTLPISKNIQQSFEAFEKHVWPMNNGLPVRDVSTCCVFFTQSPYFGSLCTVGGLNVSSGCE